MWPSGRGTRDYRAARVVAVDQAGQGATELISRRGDDQHVEVGLERGQLRCCPGTGREMVMNTVINMAMSKRQILSQTRCGFSADGVV
jgi:hypothetical protein